MNLQHGIRKAIPKNEHIFEEIPTQENLGALPVQVSDSSTSYTSPHVESPAIRKIRPLREIYETTNIVFLTWAIKFQGRKKKDIWINEMDGEIATIEKNNTWTLVDLFERKDVIGLKSVYKTKYKEDGTIEKHKPRLVSKGYS